MEARMTVCNMSIEWGAKAGLIAPDQTTFDYIEGRPRRRRAPTGTPPSRTGRPCAPTTTPSSTRRSCSTPDDDAVRHLGHQPRPGRAARRRASRPRRLRRRPGPDRRREGPGVHGPRGRHADARHQGRHRLRRLVHQRPDRGPARSPPRSSRAARRRHPAARRARLGAGAAAGRGRGPRQGLQGGRRRVARRRLLDVPGHEPRPARPGERSASTSNRNFEGRQGKGGRTHLVSVPVAAATAVRGTLSSPADLESQRS